MKNVRDILTQIMHPNTRHLLIISSLVYLAFIAGTSFTVGNERYFTLVDDAMISMRYGRNLASGQGLVWNIGEKPVQGFTNPGWTVLMGIIQLVPLPASKISLAVMLLSLGILLINVRVVGMMATSLFPGSRYAPMIAMLVTAFYFPLVFWSLRGMEVGLLVLLLNGALLLSISRSRPISTGMLLVAAVIVRLDASIMAVLIALFFLYRHRSRASLLPSLLVAITITAVLVFQQSYFGDMLPTTYYQKIAGYTVWDRVRHGILIFIEFGLRDTLFLFLFSILGLYYYNLHRNQGLLLLLVIFLAQCIYSILVGGDYAEPETNAANRFITQGMPPLIILFSVVSDRVLSDLESVRSRIGRSSLTAYPGIILGLMVILIISGEPWLDYAINNAPLLKADIRRVHIGLHIAKYTSPEAVIAVHAAGQIPYYSQRRTIDLLGLNDPIVAKGPPMGSFYPGHNKWNYEYSIGELKPDVIADNFFPFGEFIRANSNYQQLESDLYVRMDSRLVDIDGLKKDVR